MNLKSIFCVYFFSKKKKKKQNTTQCISKTFFFLFWAPTLFAFLTNTDAFASDWLRHCHNWTTETWFQFNLNHLDIYYVGSCSVWTSLHFTNPDSDVAASEKKKRTLFKVMLCKITVELFSLQYLFAVKMKLLLLLPTDDSLRLAERLD